MEVAKSVQYGAPTAWFHGQVIDMFYLDIYEVMVPSWVPLFGGGPLTIFPIFNIADVAISIGVIGLILSGKELGMQKRVHGDASTEELVDLTNG
ncbi:MAG: signal peptidase II [Bacteroidota bacterium]